MRLRVEVGKKVRYIPDTKLMQILKGLKPGEVARVRKVRKKRKNAPNKFVTKNFMWSEFHKGGRKAIPSKYRGNVRELARGLEELRKIVGPVRVWSGYRTPVENASVGGASYSQHLTASGADISAPRVSMKKLKEAAEKVAVFREGGIGYYSSHIHVDVRKGRARW